MAPEGHPEEQTWLKIFEEKRVRTHWDADAEKWWFSIADVCEVLTDSPDGRKYWSVLKTRLRKEGSELATNCSQLKMEAVLRCRAVSYEATARG